MRWEQGKSAAQEYREWLQKKKQWNAWFAWFPVTVGKERVWLEWIERQGQCVGTSESGTVYWNYDYRYPKQKINI
jgi:hypothetical protein